MNTEYMYLTRLGGLASTPDFEEGIDYLTGKAKVDALKKAGGSGDECGLFDREGNRVMLDRTNPTPKELEAYGELKDHKGRAMKTRPFFQSTYGHLLKAD